MDLITASTTFATLISLFSDFLDKRKEVSAADYQNFLDWLSENRHDELKSLLEQNQATVTSIKAILNLQSSVILEKLKNIDGKLGSILSADSLFNPLVQALSPLNSLSEQSISILKQFEDSGASTILEQHYMGDETAYIFMEGGGGTLEYNDPRFIEDDFSRLVELGLLRLELGSKSNKIYKFTREASRLVRLI